jgi:hypothetical protein
MIVAVDKVSHGSNEQLYETSHNGNGGTYRRRVGTDIGSKREEDREKGENHGGRIN